MTITASKIATSSTSPRALDVIFKQDGERAYAKGRTNIVYGNFIPVVKHPENQISISDLINELCADDADLAQSISNARKWTADSFHQSENTLKAFRLRAGLSQKDLSEMIDTSQPHIAKIEAGKADPQYSTMVKLSKALSVDFNDLAEALQNAANKAGRVL